MFKILLIKKNFSIYIANTLEKKLSLKKQNIILKGGKTAKEVYKIIKINKLNKKNNYNFQFSAKNALISYKVLSSSSSSLILLFLLLLMPYLAASP